MLLLSALPNSSVGAAVIGMVCNSCLGVFCVVGV